ncbi:hypothetical protein [Aquicella lusitana]|uniref:Uncharacterized protein n=1 Tax=Aquicella lusitana TaxID=254246 RepID=A0A370GRG6_9COXI|nr:hypothetical protein [Aquicella lusitana]RDI44543.1 hypothetical protein C8D86_10925 [Aquicella lusitana]VVC72515.1 hypothetical protein AQULUS_02270 [Aquicella lusitana]
MVIKRNIFLYLAILIPVAMIIITALAVGFYQQKRLQPKFNFVYMLVDSDQLGCQQAIEQKLFKEQVTPAGRYPAANTKRCDMVKLYLFNTRTRTSTFITLDQAQQFTFLNKLNRYKSPDGFTLESFCRTDMPLGFWNEMRLENHGVCLRQGKYREKLDLKPSREEAAYFIFIGWIDNRRPLNE